MIELLEHASSSYGPRTWHNAAQGVTLAVAVDFSTAGEKLTTKASAKNGIIHMDAKGGDDAAIEAARQLYKMLRDTNCRVVNIAGNGIYTFAKHGYCQGLVNQIVWNIMYLVHEHYPLDKVVSGGQTGADIAGLIFAERLGIPSTGMWPKGYKMRFENGVDILHTEDQVRAILNTYL